MALTITDFSDKAEQVIKQFKEIWKMNKPQTVNKLIESVEGVKE